MGASSGRTWLTKGGRLTFIMRPLLPTPRGIPDPLARVGVGRLFPTPRGVIFGKNAKIP